MYRLITKESREQARKAWINGQETEKYKDLEILATSKDLGGRIGYTLVIWRGTAGNPLVNYYYRSEQQRNEQIAYHKRCADQREAYKAAHSQKGRYVTEAAKASQLIKKILKKEYPSVNFSVRSDNFANGNSVDISWIDGIPSKEIDSFARQFQSGTFDGMTDCYNYDNKADHPQAKYVHCQRTVSQEKRDIIRKQLAEKMGIEDTDYAVIPDLYMVNVRGYNCNAPLSALVYQIAVDFDFTKGFNGVRCQMSEGKTISNMFELF